MLGSGFEPKPSSEVPGLLGSPGNQKSPVSEREVGKGQSLHGQLQPPLLCRIVRQEDCCGFTASLGYGIQRDGNNTVIDRGHGQGLGPGMHLALNISSPVLGPESSHTFVSLQMGPAHPRVVLWALAG